MNAALFSLALLGAQTSFQVSERVPRLNVEVLCKQTSAVDATMRLAEAQSFSDCMRDEGNAQQQLSVIWETAPPELRAQCEAEATGDGMSSYVDLLTCMQMSESAMSMTASSDRLRGASKHRNSK